MQVESEIALQIWKEHVEIKWVDDRLEAHNERVESLPTGRRRRLFAIRDPINCTIDCHESCRVLRSEAGEAREWDEQRSQVLEVEPHLERMT